MELCRIRDGGKPDTGWAPDVLKFAFSGEKLTLKKIQKKHVHTKISSVTVIIISVQLFP